MKTHQSSFLYVVAGLLLVIGQCAWAATAKPNVVFVLTDDQGYGDLSCHGNPILETPNLDRMHGQSVRFTDFHVSPLCTPSRGALLTGRDPGRNGAYRTSAGRTMLHAEERTLANLFAENGYVTGMFGKWHLGDTAPHRPQDYGFRDVVWHRCGGIGQVSDYWGNDYFDDTYERNGKLEKFEGYCTDIWFREGMRFIEENKNRPFFLYLPLNAPHTPIIVAEEWSKPYEDKVEKPIRAKYFGMIANIDHNFGLLRERLEELELADNTILIFMTDNGTYLGADFKGHDSQTLKGFNAGMRGRKASIYDGGHRVPFFISWPAGGLDEGRDIDTLSVHVDLFPTLAELCGIPVPTDRVMDGRSLVPLLYGEEASWDRDHVVLQFHGGAAFPEDRLKTEYSYILTDRWRLLHGRELYDMEADPAQRNDVAPEYPEVVKTLGSHYEPYWQSVVKGMRPVRLDLGNPTENPVELCSQDWYMEQGNPPWNFRLIGKLPRVTAPWMVDVKRAGRYRLTLRQFPARANKPVRAVRAKVQIAGLEKETAVNPGTTGVVLEMDLPAGESELVTYLYDEKGEAGGAYFTEIEALLPESTAIDYESFLAQHDMVWDRVPNRWEVAPFTGNGNVGFLFYQEKGGPKNIISIHVGRHDYYDHRLPHEGHEMLWIYRSRLPLGHFNLESKGDITSADLRLDLWNAELTGVIKTTKGSYAVRGLSHSTTDVIYFETDAKDGETVKITWQPDEPMPPVRATLDRGGGPKGASWDRMRKAPMPMPPAPTWSKADGMQFCFQPLHDHRGETTTGWKITGKADDKQILMASIHHSFPNRNSMATVKQNLLGALELLKHKTIISNHRKWWHDFYPLSFLTINDPEKEAFYWIQMYKLGSAMRENGPILDLMGPWYHRTFWPMVWGDLNVQLIYWTHLTANRLSVGESLPNNLDKYAGNLANNVPDHWKDSASVAALMPQDLIAHGGGSVPDMLAWISHNYWLHCEYAGDRQRMRNGLFPLLRKVGNSYLNYLKDNPVKSNDGIIHIRNSWSPEYPGGRGRDINFTIGLMQWCFQTLLDLNEDFRINDPLAVAWQNIVDNLVGFQIDEHGLRIGRDVPFDHPHRHYSHLLGFLPLAVITPEKETDARMLRTTLDHWLEVTRNKGQTRSSAMPVTGYTATGAASMYAWLGAPEKAYDYLDFLIQHDRVSPTTMYAEGNPVIESPLSFATSIHDMLLQSWGGKIRVFRGTPKKWADVAFKDLRAQGAFLVSAKKKEGVTQFVTVKSLIGSPCFVQTDIPKPKIYINGQPAKKKQVRHLESSMYQIVLKKGDTVIFTPVVLEKTDRVIEPIPVDETEQQLFGLNEKTSRLPGHMHYYRK